MTEDQKYLLYFLSEEPDVYFGDNNIPSKIKMHFSNGIEMHNTFHQLHTKKLIDEDPKRKRYYKINANGLETISDDHFNRTGTPINPKNTFQNIISDSC